MSNHSGSYMLNELTQEIISIGLLATATDEQKVKLTKKLWYLCHEYDCNWGEIIDKNLAEQLDVCCGCGVRGTPRNEQGYCTGPDGCASEA